MKGRIFLAAIAAAGMLLAAPSLENELVRMEFDDTGKVVSIRERDTGRELVAKPSEFVVAVAVPQGGARREIRPVSLAQDAEGRLVFGFGDAGEVVIAVRRFAGGWRFEVVRCNVRDVRQLRLGRIRPVCTKYMGRLVNAASDDASAVCVRIYNEGGVFIANMAEGILCTASTGEVALDAVRFAVVAGPRGRFLDAMKAMTADSGIPHSQNGGAWSLGSEDCRRSYLMCYGLADATGDDWVELCLRGGFGTLHVDSCWQSLGHYEVRTNLFPTGKAGLKALTDKAHAAGLKCDVHTLTASISFKDPWIAPRCTDGTMEMRRYTLAEALDGNKKGTDRLVVKEKPWSQHDIVMTYLGNGNVVRIGGELIQYTGFTQTPPYAFTGIKRGAYGTVVEPHAAGEPVVYPRQRFYSLLADADSPVGAEMAKIQGDLFGVCGFDQIYLDGLDGLACDPRKTDKFARMILQAAADSGKTPMYEDSLWIPSTWWWHSRIGANDYVYWGPKRSLDRRFGRYMAYGPKANFLRLNMGWWCTLLDNPRSSGYFVDDHEYLGRMCAGFDTAMSVDPGNAYVPLYSMPSAVVRYLTVLGWWERFRVARAFTDDALARFRRPREEYRLRQDADGVWRAQRVVCAQHRVASADLSKWTVDSDGAAPLALRVEMLECAERFDHPKARTILDPTKAAEFEAKAAKGVTVAKTAASDAERGPVVRIEATNSSATPTGAWSRVSQTYKAPYFVLPDTHHAFGVWVKGDGSGALLNVQLECPREHSSGRSEHYAKLDFTGWRYFEFCLRERDSNYDDHVWPYMRGGAIDYPLSRVSVKNVSSVNLYINEIPAGGKTCVEVGAVRMLPVRGGVLMAKGAVVSVGGADFHIPFKMAPRNFAEFENGWWTRYDRMGRPIERARGETPSLKPGANAFAFSATTSSDAFARVRVTAFALREKIDALKPGMTARSEPRLAYEAVEPRWYAPASGFDDLGELVARPGESATVGFEVYGPTAPFKVSVGDETRNFPFALGPKEYLTCRDGRRWQLRRRGADAGIARTGEIEPFAALSGAKKASFACDEPDKAFARIDFVKRYGTAIPAR
ncbi:MAG: hypothetical protein IKO72_16335 [Kiritimatiellae bacterium]|nr:hypothetical protein [Kiritimatiellia bacterium]